MNKKRFKKYLTQYQQVGCPKGYMWNPSTQQCVPYEDSLLDAPDSPKNYFQNPEEIEAEITQENLMEDPELLSMDDLTPPNNWAEQGNKDLDSWRPKEDKKLDTEGVQFPSYTYDLPSAATFLGQSIKNKDPYGIVAGGFKTLAGTARNVMSGMGLANREQQVRDEQAKNLRDKSRGTNTPTFVGRDGGKMTLPKKLTGDYVGEEQMMMPNAELEGGEFKQDNQGNVQEVVGETHERGGVEMNLEEGEKILSDHLKIGGDLAKELRDNLEIKVKATDTYSDVMDKLTKASGLKKITKEQEEVIKKLSKLETEDEDTREINETFLKNKINELEQKKQPLLEDKKMAFDILFEKQEASKVKKEKEEFFKDGGIMDTVTKMSVDFGLPIEDTKEIYFDEYKKGGMIKRKDGSYSKRGLWDNIRANKGSGKEPTKEMLEQEKKIKAQKKEDGGEYLPEYQDGGVRDKLIKLAEDSIKDEKKLEILKSQLESNELDGRDIDFLNEAQASELLKGLGITKPDNMSNKNMLQEVVDNVEYDWEGFDSTFDSVADYDNYQRSITEAGDVVLPTQFENIIGKNTPKRPNNLNRDRRFFEEDNLVYTPPIYKDDFKVKKEIEDKNLQPPNDNTIIPYLPNMAPSQRVMLPEVTVLAPKNTPNLEEDVYDKSLEGTQALFDSLEIDDEGNFFPSDKEKIVDPKNTNDTNTTTQEEEEENKDPIMFASQMRLPPTGVQPHWMPNRTFDRVDAQQLSETPYFEQANKMTDEQLRAIKDLPPAQRAAALASISASSSQSAAQLAADIDLKNAQLRQQSDQINTQTQRMEENAGVQDALSYEQRQLMALDNTQQDIRRYFDALGKDSLMKAQQSGQIKLLNDMYGDVAYTGDGTVEQTTDVRERFKNMTSEQKDLFMKLYEEDKNKKKKKYGGRLKKYKR